MYLPDDVAISGAQVHDGSARFEIDPSGDPGLLYSAAPFAFDGGPPIVPPINEHLMSPSIVCGQHSVAAGRDPLMCVIIVEIGNNGD